MIKSNIMKTAAVAAVLGLPFATAAKADNVEVGALDCTVSGGEGFIFKSTKELACTFKSIDGSRPVDTYAGSITKYGLDIGKTDKALISWVVFAPTGENTPPGALAGEYGGVSAEATIGAGLGANVLVGGLEKSIALQPVSVSAQTGLNFALAISELKLTDIPD
ncbi:DUF992 domain-containing protein [Flavimaribacter sediminis]|nr:DUF992 domain-containing protein [Flavimaribacter sediminis]